MELPNLRIFDISFLIYVFRWHLNVKPMHIWHFSLNIIYILLLLFDIQVLYLCLAL